MTAMGSKPRACSPLDRATTCNGQRPVERGRMTVHKRRSLPDRLALANQPHGQFLLFLRQLGLAAEPDAPRLGRSPVVARARMDQLQTSPLIGTGLSARGDTPASGGGDTAQGGETTLVIDHT